MSCGFREYEGEKRSQEQGGSLPDICCWYQPVTDPSSRKRAVLSGGRHGSLWGGLGLQA